MTDEHIVTAEEPALTEQCYRPGDDGEPEKVPDSLSLRHLEVSIESRYSCSCGAELRSWMDVVDHFEEVAANGSVPSGRVVSEEELPGEQVTFDEV